MDWLGLGLLESRNFFTKVTRDSHNALSSYAR
jgi:hypothetical protein